MDWSKIGDILQNGLLGLGGCFAAIYACSKKFRNWINNKLKDTDSIKDLNTKQKELQKEEETIKDTCKERTETINETLKALNNSIQQLDKKMDNLEAKIVKDNKSTLLTLKCQIIDICSRVSRYGGITQPDKKLLCELYTEYVDVWKQNHYVKSEALKVIESAPIINEYKEQMIEIVKGQV